jgi:uncharacterized membrane protein YgcG
MKRLIADKKGAVLAEFVVAIFPLLTIFFVFVQYSMLATSALIVKHSAVIGARAAAVFANEKQNVPEQCSDNGLAKVDDAVRAAIGPWQNRISTTTTVRDQSSRSEDGVYDLVTVTVTARVRCTVPLGKFICGLGGSHEIIDIKSMPHQGARYKTRQCNGNNNGGGGGGFGGFGGGRSGGGGAGGSWGPPGGGGFSGGGGSFGGGGASGRWP